MMSQTYDPLIIQHRSVVSKYKIFVAKIKRMIFWNEHNSGR